MLRIFTELLKVNYELYQRTRSKKDKEYYRGKVELCKMMIDLWNQFYTEEKKVTLNVADNVEKNDATSAREIEGYSTFVDFEKGVR